MGGDTRTTTFALENDLYVRRGVLKGRARDLDAGRVAARITAHIDNYKILNLRCLVVVSEMASEKRCWFEIGRFHCNNGAHAQILADWHSLRNAYRSRAQVAVGKKNG